MNAKILAIVAVAAIAVAGISVAYAMTAGSENSENDIDTNFLKMIQLIDNSDSESASQTPYVTSGYSETFEIPGDKIIWDSVTTIAGTKYTISTDYDAMTEVNAPTLEAGSVAKIKDNTLDGKGVIELGHVYLELTDEDMEDGVAAYDFYVYYGDTTAQATTNIVKTNNLFFAIGKGDNEQAALNDAQKLKVDLIAPGVDKPIVFEGAGAATATIDNCNSKVLCITLYALYENFHAAEGSNPAYLQLPLTAETGDPVGDYDSLTVGFIAYRAA